jgi:predicted RNA-binding Zn-ribbon protein involved in translation (DUF1610 family)
MNTEKTSLENESQPSCLGGVISRFLCDECGWIGTRDEARREFDFGYDQSCCPKCGNVMFDNLHGNDYAEKVV